MMEVYGKHQVDNEGDASMILFEVMSKEDRNIFEMIHPNVLNGAFKEFIHTYYTHDPTLKEDVRLMVRGSYKTALLEAYEDIHQNKKITDSYYGELLLAEVAFHDEPHIGFFAIDESCHFESFMSFRNSLNL